MSDPETVAFYDRAAERAAQVNADGPPEPTLARFMDTLPEHAKVLDLGCGHGIASAHLARAGHDVTGLDASAGLLEVARRLAPTARFLHAGFDDLDAVAEYNGIWANYALLHAPRAAFPGHLARIARALKSGGLLHLSMLVGDDERRDDHGRAYSYFTETALDAMLAAEGFTALARDTGERSGYGGVVEPFVAYLMEIRA